MIVQVTATPQTEGTNTAGGFNLYEPERQLILFLRQQRNLLPEGETLRIEVEVQQDTYTINLANLARFRRLVLAA